MISGSRLRSHSEYSLCSAETGWTAWARRMLATPPRTGRKIAPCPGGRVRRPRRPPPRSARPDRCDADRAGRYGRCQPAQRALHRLADMLRPAVALGADLLAVLEAKPELGGDHHLVAPPLERPAEQLLVGERAVDLGRVEERAAQLDGAMQRGDRLALVGRAVGLAHAHAAQTDRRYFQPLSPQFAFGHSHDGCAPVLL
jgi:hypothetical protein